MLDGNTNILKGIIVGLIVTAIISSCKGPNAEFMLIGTTNGIENGTVLYLNNVLTKEIIDSVLVQNNSFKFKSKQIKAPLQAVLYSRGYAHYRFLWLENKPMVFDGTKTDFKNANVTGSESENLYRDLYTEISSLPRVEQAKKEMEFVRNNPTSIVSADILSTYSTTWGKVKTKELFEQFSAENKISIYGQKIEKYIELNKDPRVGEQFVDFEMPNPTGINKKLSDMKGKIVLLEFWASWCGPCRKENPNLVKTYKVFNPKGFEVFAVSLDEDSASWIKAIEKDNLIWEHVSDLKGQENEASLIYGINGIPDNFLIDKNGDIIGRNLRGERLNERLTELLN